MNPLPVTVLTSVYNGALYLDAAIESILAQSFADFEFILVDDASTDETPAMLAAWAQRDARIVLVRNESNLGLTRSLNKGIRLARGEWIARQDADDISLPWRLEKQLAFLAAHPEVGLLGTGFISMDACGTLDQDVRVNPLEHTEICWHLLSANPFFHTSVMFRRALGLLCPYDETLRYGQDFELWGRLLSRTRGANLADPIVCSRRHEGRVSMLYHQQQQEIGVQILCQRYAGLLPDVPWSDEEVKAVRALAVSRWPVVGERVESSLLLLRLFRAFASQEGWERKALSRIRDQLLDRLWRSVGVLPMGEKWILLRAMWRHDPWQVLRSMRRELGRVLSLSPAPW